MILSETETVGRSVIDDTWDWWIWWSVCFEWIWLTISGFYLVNVVVVVVRGERKRGLQSAVEVSSEELTVKVPRRYLSLRQVQQRRQKLFSLPAAGLQQQQQAPPSSAATATCRDQGVTKLLTLPAGRLLSVARRRRRLDRNVKVCQGTTRISIIQICSILG